MPDAIEPRTAAPNWGEAARLLEQAAKITPGDANVLYLLAMAYKHLKRNGEARQTLAKIAEPDANVSLQQGLLAYSERDYSQAEKEFASSWERDPASYAAGYNLLLARACQGQIPLALEVFARLVPLAPTPEETRFLGIVRALLSRNGDANEQDYLLQNISPSEEERVIAFVSGLSPFELVYDLLSRMVHLRPQSTAAFRAFIGVALVRAKQLLDRCHWREVTELLQPLQRRLASSDGKLDAMEMIAIHNMLGVSACMEQEVDRGLQHFRQAHEHFARDFSAGGAAERAHRYVNGQGVYLGAWLEQNLALANEWSNRLDLAETHWTRYLDFLEHYFSRSLPPSYLADLAFECANRLADLYSRKEQWGSASFFLQRAHKVRPTDHETLEHLFQLLTQLKRTDEARRILKKIREVKPNDPQADLFDLEVREVRKLDEVEALVADLRRLHQKYAGDARVMERTGAIVHNLLPVLEKLTDQFASQVNKVVNQMRRLPNHEINWAAVRGIMHDMEDKYVILRRVAQRLQSLAGSESDRNELTRMVSHCDRKIDQCRSLGE